MTKTTRMSLILVLLAGLAMAGAAHGDLTLPYYGLVSEAGYAFKISNSYPGTGLSYGGFFYAGGVESRGVFGQSAGAEGMGVKGWAANDGDVQNYGGHFCATGARGIGVYGWAENLAPGATNYGGYFQADGGQGIGVRAKGGANGFAGVFEGDIKIVGSGKGITFPDGSRQTRAGGGSSDGDWTISGNNMYSAVSGNVGIGATAPSAKLEVGTIAESGTAIVASAGGLGGCGVKGVAVGPGGIGVHATAPAVGTGLVAKGLQAARLYGRVSIHDFFTEQPLIELGAGLDYAEGFDVTAAEGIGPGHVLIIDPQNPGNLTLSTIAYDTKVAGIVAGAKGLGSGVRLGTGESDHDVALAGRVYCNVDATETAVAPGDLLTTSATPGFAMKVSDHVRAQGAILGKAMESLEQGKKGQILVLVTLQ